MASDALPRSQISELPHTPRASQPNPTDAAIEAESRKLDVDKKRLEIDGLRRNAHLEHIRLLLAAVGAFAFLAGFLFDRFKLREQRETDRRVAIASDFDQLHARTTAALFKEQKNPLLLRLNIETYRDRVKDTEKQLGDSKPDPKKQMELRAFLAERS